MQAISGTMLRDLLLCERRLGLDLHGDPAQRDKTSPFVRMLWAEGLAHEETVLSTLGGEVVDLRERPREDRERETSVAIAAGAPAILGAVIAHGDLVGMPDLLLLTDAGHMAVDVKAGAATSGPRDGYKPEYLVQVAHYAHILARSALGRGDVAAIIDADGRRVDYDLSLPFGRDRLDGAPRHLRLLERARAIRDGEIATRGAMSAQCGLCDWRSRCSRELREADDLTLVVGLGRSLRPAIEAVAPDVAALGRLPPPAPGAATGLAGVGAERLARFIDRARLLADPDAGPVVRDPLGLPAAGHTVDFDVEADPVRGLVYLHGFWHEGRPPGTSGFAHFFAETPDAAGERDAFARAVDHFRLHRDAHWFHYSAYERTAYRGLALRHPDVCGMDEIDAMFDPSRCTDLYGVVARATDWPLSSYSIKSIAKACGFAWEDLDPGGAASIEWYDRYVRHGDPGLRERIVAYNRDDVRASGHVRAALAELELTGRIAGFRRPS